MGRHKAAIKRLFTRTPGYPPSTFYQVSIINVSLSLICLYTSASSVCFWNWFVCLFVRTHNPVNVMIHFSVFAMFLSFGKCNTWLFIIPLSMTNRLERDALPLFQMLRQKYKPSLDRDSALDEVCHNFLTRHCQSLSLWLAVATYKPWGMRLGVW